MRRQLEKEEFMSEIDIKKTVRETYGSIAETKGSCCPGGCGGDNTEFAKAIGYSDGDLQMVPEDANLGLSCGNSFFNRD
ncbi:MAG: tRNA (adenine57/58-N1)-methyltransferase [Deltaproteobacteria bacterium]|nr:tRNA (adenine57/58-N1)-methyltransferase [Deltaproteobacteria bacterium]